MTIKSDIKVAKCKACKVGTPKAVAGENRGTVKLRCNHCGVQSSDHHTVGEAVKNWEKMNS